MKNIIKIALLSILFSCNQQNYNITAELQQRITNLEDKIGNAYKPGLGELMGSIQMHHSKLWFAGKAKNRKLAEFELHELKEIIADVSTFQSERKESEQIGMISPALDIIETAIKENNSPLFERSYRQLTNSCNNCHRINHYEYIIIKVPEVPVFGNQEF